MELERFIIEEDTSIIDSMKKIDENGYGIVFVCENDLLKGVISDGDIRRYILQNGDLKGSVKKIVNYSPKFLVESSKNNVQEFIRENKITAVPILDRDGRIIRIESDNKGSVYRTESLAVPLVVMAGGKGTRLYPYTQVLPKPLIPIGEKTIIEHIIERFQKYDCNDVYMIVNYKKNIIKAFFEDSNQKINFIEEKEFLGTGGGLKLLQGMIHQTFFMTNCDILINACYSDIYKYHKKNRNILTMVCAMKDFVLPYGTVELDEHGRVKSFSEKPEYSFLTNTGLYIIEPEFLDRIKENEFVHITDVIQQCIDSGERVGVYPVSENAWMDMGQLDEMDKMKNRLEMER